MEGARLGAPRILAPPAGAAVVAPPRGGVARALVCAPIFLVSSHGVKGLLASACRHRPAPVLKAAAPGDHGAHRRKPPHASAPCTDSPIDILPPAACCFSCLSNAPAPMHGNGHEGGVSKRPTVIHRGPSTLVGGTAPSCSTQPLGLA